jgi:hypothetical protein
VVRVENRFILQAGALPVAQVYYTESGLSSLEAVKPALPPTPKGRGFPRLTVEYEHDGLLL